MKLPLSMILQRLRPVLNGPVLLRRLLWSLGGLCLLWGVAWLALPPLLKSQIEAKGSATLGRKLTLGAVDFKPWSLELTVTDIAVATADGKGHQLVIARLYADAELESLWHLAPVLDAIIIEGPKLQLTHLGAGYYDIDDMVDTLNRAPKSDPLKFALYNLTLNGGAVDFSDRASGAERKHTLRALHVALPFLSNLDSKRNVKVHPRLAFELNGSGFDTAVDGTFFSRTRKGEAALKITHLDLAPYLPYQPASWPLRVQAAVVDADLRLAFTQSAQSVPSTPATVSLAGQLQVSGLALSDAAGGPLLGVQTIDVALADVRPLERVVKLASLDITAPKLWGTRNRAGQINLSLGVAKRGAGQSSSTRSSPESSPEGRTAGIENATEIIATSADNTGATAPKGIKNAAKPLDWTLSLDRLTLHRGEVVWVDNSTPQPARLTLAQLELQAQGLHWPLDASPATLEGSATVASKGRAAQLAFKGEGTDVLASVHASISDADLGLAAPYLAQWLDPKVLGQLDAELDATWQPSSLELKLPRISVRNFALQASKETALAADAPGAERAAAQMPSFKLLEITDTQLDFTGKNGTVGKLVLRQPSAMLHRDAQGQWLPQRWMKTAAAPVPPVPSLPLASQVSSADSATANGGTDTPKPASPWQLSVANLLVDDATVRLDDRSLSRPVRMEVSALKLQMNNVALDGKKPAPLKLSARVKSGRTEPGSLNVQGTVMWAPLAVQATVEAVDIPAHALAPYFADRLNMALLRADTSFKGQLRYAATAAGAEVLVQGDAALEDFRANSVSGPARTENPASADISTRTGNAGSAGASPVLTDDLGVAEELLSWKSLNVPGLVLDLAPGTATRVQVREAALTDFFARVIVNPTGRLNLQDLVKSAPVPATAATPVVSAATEAIITVGPISLVHGKVLFSDRFIQPNYSADLTELTGKLSQFSSRAATDGTVQLADLELRGRAEGTASLEITGKVNPLAKPLALDVQGKVRDLELPPLSAYAIKYAGYGIQRGKLSLDVSYTVKPDGQLTASNKLVLNQLSFGDKVEGAPNSLPVKLAVALLADRHGVIDLNLPISGSLNDPQFSVGAVVWKVITNLVTKALTSPFSLLASVFGGDGGGDELSAVDFAPGRSVLTTAAMQSLDQVAKALTERPALSMTVVGTASLQAERDALKQERLKALMLGEKRRRAVVNGQDAASVGSVTDDETPALLKEVYRRADITKPRNLVGMAKDIPAAEMQALMLASIAVTEDGIRALALQRGVVVKDYLVSRKLPTERLFLGAPKTLADSADWKPHADLSLTNE